MCCRHTFFRGRFFCGATMDIYLDESRDLVWTFGSLYGHGGSSRYLTISALIIPKDLSRDGKIQFSKRSAGLPVRKPSIHISEITVKKEGFEESGFRRFE